MAKSSFYVERRPLTRADELRHQLDELEASVGRLGHSMGQEALTIPSMFDAVVAALASFQAEGHSMRAEEARLKTVSAEFRRKAAVFLREIGGADTLEAARRLRQPDLANWWWFLDQMVAHERWARLRRLALTAVGVGAVLLLLFALYQRFLAPDPATRERLKHQYAAEGLVVGGDLAGALDEIEQGLAIESENPSLLIFKGALQQALGQEAAAEEAFALAEATIDDQEAFLLARGRTYLLLDQAPAALDDALKVITLNPESAAGYMLMGRSYEVQEELVDAIVAYEQAASLAEAQKDFQLAGTARVNIGMLMQRLQAQPKEVD